ncbi:cytochrome [Amycolatopsis coloradensis]|uniref:Cytochrome n=1 Tax=Amycolatopsis coloradensis TaxID=76021 RepID=A0A1R0KZE7_9PSEU|nr:cytochrome P450 [Amycolatopsis coloradensis]OLZ54644.1 cytochrome [Amycolatopsis coloradensis]
MTTRQGPRAVPSEQVLKAATRPGSAVDASIKDTLRIATRVLLPILLTGVLKRRPRAMALAQKFQTDRAAARLHGELRHRYGDHPLHLRLPGCSIDLALSPETVGTVLAGTPSPFSPATREKKAALGKFQPHGVLISEGHERAIRRELNEAVLEPGRELHELAEPWARVIAAQAGEMLDAAALDWDTFATRWWRIVRQVTLGGDTTEDRELTDLLASLRLAGNWAYAGPRRRRTRERFLELVRHQVALRRPGSLAAALAAAPDADGLDPAGQLPHWLFAFDAAGIVTFRTLALLAAHPEHLAAIREELEDTDLSTPQRLPRTRASVLESVRLWPTTPALLRETRGKTAWGPDRTTVFVYTPYFHRDVERLPYADRFEPAIWLDGRAADNPALVPFSGGPGACPGRDVVLFATSMLLAHLVRDHDIQSSGALLTPGKLPLTLDNFGLRFRLHKV